MWTIILSCIFVGYLLFMVLTAFLNPEVLYGGVLTMRCVCGHTFEEHEFSMDNNGSLEPCSYANCTCISFEPPYSN